MIRCLCGNKIKKKDPHHGKKEGDVCDQCWKDYLKQNRQMSIETAVYQEGQNVS